jgi:hypothetical protein
MHMARLFLQVCLNHPGREAIARCPECRQCFCRECVTEHGERMVCAACLRKQARAAVPRRFRWRHLVTLGRGVGGLLLAWFFFYSAGRLLLAIPDSFHEGVIGHSRGLDEE